VTADIDPRYVAARRVLLDALVALSAHSDALVVAGAQAVYLHTGEGDLAVAPFTTDSDLTVDPAGLASDPLLETAMTGAGFALDISRGHIEPGIWLRSVCIDGVDVLVPVDLIVPTAAAPPGGRRGARLGEHGRRLDDKDALDCLRIMQTSAPAQVGATLRALQDEPVAAAVTAAATEYLERLFARRGRPGIRMAANALRFVMPEARVEAICVAYTEALLTAATQA
jgi:hypothetical protein